MTDDRPKDQLQLKQALGPAADCPDIEQLGQYSDGILEPATRSAMASHISSCAYCRSELAMLREFQEVSLRPEEQRPVAWITSQLRQRAPQISSPVPEPQNAVTSWWRSLLTPPFLSRAGLAFATLLVIISASLYLRRSTAPTLNTNPDSGAEVLRSNSVLLLSPKGDLTQRPDWLRWQAVEGAARYQVRILEVDRTELWNRETSAVGIQIPDAVRAQILASKSLLWQVTALDPSGKRIGSSNLERFRVAPTPP